MLNKEQLAQIEAVREKIENVILDWKCGAQINSSLANQILSLPEIAILDTDQNLPETPKFIHYMSDGSYYLAQKSMLSAHFQKTISKEKMK
jgi:hypothetical protein